MATMNFPTSPYIGQAYTFGVFTWIYNGSGWALNNLNGTSGSIPFYLIDYVYNTQVMAQPQETFTLINFV